MRKNIFSLRCKVGSPLRKKEQRHIKVFLNEKTSLGTVWNGLSYSFEWKKKSTLEKISSNFFSVYLVPSNDSKSSKKTL